MAMAIDMSELPAWTQAAALTEGTATSRDLLERCLERIARRDPAIGAFWRLDADGARDAADASDARRRAGRALGPFDGIALAVKDNIDVAGLPATAGIAARRGRIAPDDAPAAARLRAAGLVILGKTALDEGALGATTDAPGFGRCDNPLGPGLTPGGSSGGSAAAVAARFAPLAIGTDTMGSVRIPAAYCGVTGLKPTAGLVSRTGVMPLSSTLDSVGILALTPRDAAFGLELMAGFDAADVQSRKAPPGWRALPAEPSARPRQAGGLAPLAHLVIGLPRGLDRIGIEPAVMDAYGQACRRLEACGASLAEIAIERWEIPRLRLAALLLAEAEASVAHASLIDDPSAASRGYRAALAFGRNASAQRLLAAFEQINWARSAMERAFDGIDAVFLPTALQRAFAHGAAVPATQADLTVLANAAGLPAIAVPWPAGDGGLPTSMQVIGKAFDEAAIVAVGEALIVRH